jgi:hypothetical protein
MTYLPQSTLAKWREANKPERCPILNSRVSDWVVDHDHRTGFVRGVISRSANSLLGKVENFLRNRCGEKPEDYPRILRNLADYLEREKVNVLHPVGLTQLCKRFKNYLTADEQHNVLLDIGAEHTDLDKCRNAIQRTALFRQLTKLNHESQHTTKIAGDSVIPQSPEGADE